MGQRFSVSVNVSDPGADMLIPLLRVPTGEVYTVEECHVAADTTQAGAAGTYWEASLENGGASGTARTVISGTAGGTPGWVANTPQAVAVTEGSGKLTAGQYLNLNYDETGAPAPGRFTVMLQVTRGKGGKA